MPIQPASPQATQTVTHTLSLPPTGTSQGSPCLSPTQADTSTAQIQQTQNTTLTGHVVPNVLNGKASRVATMPDSADVHLEVVFKLRNAAAFEQCLASLSDPTSPNYRRFLNASMLQPYAPTPGQKQSVAAFLRRGGFTVTDGPSPLVLELSGNVSTVTRTFGTMLRLYRQGKGLFYSPDTEPRMPQSLSALVTGITGLDNFTVIRPAETPCGSQRPSAIYCPQAIQVGYDFANLYSAGHDGTGQKVAIVDAPGDPDTQLAVDTYDKNYSLANTKLTIMYPSGPVGNESWDPGWASEAALDVEAVHSAAPGANITLLYESDLDLMSAVDYVASNHTAPIVSNSWTYACASNPAGPCSDTQLPKSIVSAVDVRLSLDAAQGLTILFASGDKGATPDNSTLGTNFPASDPNVLAVGATDLIMHGCGSSSCLFYVNEGAASISGGGYSGYFAEPSWQTYTIGSTSGRAVPDVSMVGGLGSGFWVYSSSASVCGGGAGGGWFGCAGTSLSTQLWAGFLAIALQVKGVGEFGNIGPLIYQIGHSSSYSNDFHDITTGNNKYNWTCGHSTCGYEAVPGWDAATGWGSPIADKLANDLSGVFVSTDQSSYKQTDFLKYTGAGLTPNSNKVLACISTNNALNVLCVTAASADNFGNVVGSMQVGINVPPGPQKFLIEDNATGTPRVSNQVQLTIFPVGTTTRILVTGVDAGQGSVSPSCAKGCPWPVGKAVSVNATANTGWRFSGWSNMSGITCQVVSCVFNMPNNQVILKATFTQIVPLSSISSVVSASAGSAWFVLPDYTAGQGSMTHTSLAKCGGVKVALATDVYAGTYLFGALTNPQQNEILDTNSAYISQSSSSCGQPKPSTNSSQPLVTIAGTAVSETVHYYESIEKSSPLYYNFATGCITRRDTNVGVSCNFPSTPTKDVFVMEAFTDLAGRTVYIIYGLNWPGTLAGYAYLVNTVLKNPTQFSKYWYVYQWQDAASGVSANSIPDPGDTYTQIASGP